MVLIETVLSVTQFSVFHHHKQVLCTAKLMAVNHLYCDWHLWMSPLKYEVYYSPSLTDWSLMSINLGRA